MSSFFISGFVFLILVASAFLGLQLRRLLPEHHLGSDTKDAVRMGMGTVATMAALLLGLLVASTKAAYDTEKDELIRMAAKIVVLDQVLRDYGPESDECRRVLRSSLEQGIARTWPQEASARGHVSPDAAWTHELPLSIVDLDPGDDARRALKEKSLELAFELGELRWLLYEQAETTISYPLLVIMIGWIALTFLSTGLFAPTNATVVMALAVASLSIATALFLILELDHPFAGVVKISSDPLLMALRQLSR